MLSCAKRNFNFCNEVFLVASILNSNTDVKVNCQADFNHKEREECRLFFALFAFFAVKVGVLLVTHSICCGCTSAYFEARISCWAGII